MIADLIERFKKLVDLSHDPLVFPTPNIYKELAQEWFNSPVVSREQEAFVMRVLRKELDRQSLFESMNQKFKV